jgi:hypothetical protein
MVDGVITRDEYDLFSADFRRKIDDAENHISHLQDELTRVSKGTSYNELLERFKEYRRMATLDRRMVVSFIHSIIVCDSNAITIRLRIDNEFDVLSPAQEKAVV